MPIHLRLWLVAKSTNDYETVVPRHILQIRFCFPHSLAVGKEWEHVMALRLLQKEHGTEPNERDTPAMRDVKRLAAEGVRVRSTSFWLHPSV